MNEIAREILPVNLEEEMRRSYLDYAMSVIVGRALPDVRDGLKPVHRRVTVRIHEARHQNVARAVMTRSRCEPPLGLGEGQHVDDASAVDGQRESFLSANLRLDAHGPARTDQSVD